MSDFMKYVGGSTAGAVTLGAVTATAAAWYYMSRYPAPHFPVDLNQQTKEVPVRFFGLNFNKHSMYQDMY